MKSKLAMSLRRKQMNEALEEDMIANKRVVAFTNKQVAAMDQDAIQPSVIDSSAADQAENEINHLKILLEKALNDTQNYSYSAMNIKYKTMDNVLQYAPVIISYNKIAKIYNQPNIKYNIKEQIKNSIMSLEQVISNIVTGLIRLSDDMIISSSKVIKLYTRAITSVAFYSIIENQLFTGNIQPIKDADIKASLEDFLSSNPSIRKAYKKFSEDDDNPDNGFNIPNTQATDRKRALKAELGRQPSNQEIMFSSYNNNVNKPAYDKATARALDEASESESESDPDTFKFRGEWTDSDPDDDDDDDPSSSGAPIDLGAPAEDLESGPGSSKALSIPVTHSRIEPSLKATLDTLNDAAHKKIDTFITPYITIAESDAENVRFLSDSLLKNNKPITNTMPLADWRLYRAQINSLLTLEANYEALLFAARGVKTGTITENDFERTQLDKAGRLISQVGAKEKQIIDISESSIKAYKAVITNLYTTILQYIEDYVDLLPYRAMSYYGIDFYNMNYRTDDSMPPLETTSDNEGSGKPQNRYSKIMRKYHPTGGMTFDDTKNEHYKR
jgi:hypothetical protein